jgi:predicted Zn-dependent protease
LQKNPDFPDALWGLFGVYTQRKQLAKAVARAEAQVAKVPNSSALQLVLAQAWLLNNKPESAEAALEKAVALDNKNAGAFLLLA